MDGLDGLGSSEGFPTDVQTVIIKAMLTRMIRLITERFVNLNFVIFLKYVKDSS